MLQPKKHSMMETTTMMLENTRKSPMRAATVFPNLVASTLPHTSPPRPPPISPTAAARPPFDVCLVNNADSAVNTGGAIKDIQNQNHLILNGGGSLTGPGFTDGNP